MDIKFIYTGLWVDKSFSKRAIQKTSKNEVFFRDYKWSQIWKSKKIYKVKKCKKNRQSLANYIWSGAKPLKKYKIYILKYII